MLAFLIFTGIVIGIYGCIHKYWNSKRQIIDAEPGGK